MENRTMRKDEKKEELEKEEMTIVDLLQGAKKIIEKEERWTTGCSATDVDGLMVNFDSCEAYAWDSRSALLRELQQVVLDKRITRGEKDAFFFLANSLLRQAANTPNFSAWQDYHTHKELMEVWEKAIELAKEIASKEAVEMEIQVAS